MIAVNCPAELEGGGTFATAKFIEILKQRVGRVDHVFEYCCGAGSIGFSLLASGFCEKLTLSDINPAAIEECDRTISKYGLKRNVSTYVSDCLERIPKGKKWDVVVGNPPHWDGSMARYRRDMRSIDPGFRIHREFYKNIGEYLKPGGFVLFYENALASSVRDFKQMIESGGLEVVDVIGPKRFSSTLELARPLVRRAFLPFVGMNKWEYMRKVTEKLGMRPLEARHFYFILSQNGRPAVRKGPRNLSSEEMSPRNRYSSGDHVP